MPILVRTRNLATLSFALWAPCALPQTPTVPPLAQQIAALLAQPSVARDHWGVQVTAMDGAPLFSLNEAQLFQPASNAKLYTTAAAMASLHGDATFETRVLAHGTYPDAQTLDGDLYLVGGGDPNFSGRILPYTAAKSAAADPLRYLAELADAVAATGLKTVRGGVVGDDTMFPYEPYPSDWAIDDAVWGYGAPVSALTIDDNQMILTIKPGAKSGEPAMMALDQTVPFYNVERDIATGPAKSVNSIHVERAIGSRTLRVYGSIAADATPDVEEIAIEDPAEYAAMAFERMLEERGIAITGSARAKHRESLERRGVQEQTREPIQPGLFHATLSAGCGDAGRPELEAGETVLATHRSAPLALDVTLTNKVSQNLHAELLLHAMASRLTCVGSTAQGARVVRQFLLDAGLDKDDFVFFDGSGLSGHDLVTPRATAKLLAYAATQPWFAAWKASLPVGGVDGSLEGRFTQPPLKGHVFAKTGSLGEVRTLSGYLECASGRTVIFSIMDGNHLPGTSADRETIDRVVAAIAAAN